MYGGTGAAIAMTRKFRWAGMKVTVWEVEVELEEVDEEEEDGEEDGITSSRWRSS